MKVGRVKGFPIQFPRHLWQSILVAYDVSRARGQNSPAMDEVAALIPNLRQNTESLHSALKLGELDIPVEPDYIGPPEWIGDPTQCRSKTIRVRASQVEGAIQLLRYARLVCGWGSVNSSISSRLRKLESISELDLMSDAGR